MSRAAHGLSPIRVVIADDSKIAVERIRQTLETQAHIHVVATASCAQELLTAIDAHAPDVVTLDLLMPDRPGLALIRGLCARTSLVVVSDSDEGSQLANESLAQGAHAFVPKKNLGTRQGEAVLIQAVTRLRRGATPKALVAIAGSTGAMAALELFAADLADIDACVVVLQHLPVARMKDFAAWLTSLGLRCAVAPSSVRARAGDVHVAPGDKHLRLVNGDQLVHDDSPAVNGHKPSATVLFKSLSVCKWDVILVVLSGMGNDGAAAVPELVQRGARCIVQRHATCPVPGMPDSALLAAGARGWALDPREIGLAVRSLVNREARV